MVSENRCSSKGTYSVSEIRLICGDASKWWASRRPDLVFTNPYAPIPRFLHGLPSFISLYHPAGQDRRGRIDQTQRWIGSELIKVSDWGLGGNNALYVANLPVRPIDLTDLVEDTYQPGIGWFPLELPMRVMDIHKRLFMPGDQVWDGFCGRGTVAKACQTLGLDCVSIDIDRSRVELARQYLDL